MLKNRKTRNGVVLLWSLGVMALLVSSGRAVADDAKGPPAGLRVQNTGNSWGFNYHRLRAIEAAAGITGGEYYRHSETIDGKAAPIYTFGCLGGKDNAPRPCATLKAILGAGKVDVFTYTHSNWHETDTAEEVAEFGLKHNPNFRLLWQAGWNVHDGLGISKNGPARDAVKIADLQAALDKNRKPVETRVDAINKNLGKRVVYLVPVGEAFVKLRAMVVDGKFPGVTKQSQLYNDDMPHQGRLGSLLQDYCIFTALYHRSPIGLNVTLDKSITDEQNTILQQIAWETVSTYRYAGIARESKNSLGMRLVYIPPGKFAMGSPESEQGREAQEVQHDVELTKGFYLGTHEVTVGQFRQFVNDAKYQTDGERDGKGGWGVNDAGSIEMNGKYTWKSPGFKQTDDHPAVLISWNDAQAFCHWLSEKENKQYRLSTEAEWEYACRAGTKTVYAFGNDPQQLSLLANVGDRPSEKPKDGHRFTAPVGQFKKNGFGLHDLQGNVWEWCEDWYVPNSFTDDKQTDPTGPATGTAKVQRGGGWSSAARRCRSAARVGRHPSEYRGCYLGFRVVLVPSSAATAQVSTDLPRPARLRLAIDGNSWSVWPQLLIPIAKDAGIQGQIDGTKDAKQRLEKGEIGVVTYGMHWWGSEEPNRTRKENSNVDRN
jgi:sulfatase modifying factor 1